jgi:hypothetical protein
MAGKPVTKNPLKTPIYGKHLMLLCNLIPSTGAGSKVTQVILKMNDVMI